MGWVKGSQQLGPGKMHLSCSCARCWCVGCIQAGGTLRRHSCTNMGLSTSVNFSLWEELGKKLNKCLTWSAELLANTRSILCWFLVCF